MSHTIHHTVLTFSACLRLPGSHCQNSSQSLMLHRQTLLHYDADAVIQQIRIRTVGRPPVMIDQWHRSWIVQCAVLVQCLAGGPTRLPQCCISMATLHQQQFLANVNSHSRWLYVVARPSVVCVSVICNVHASYSGGSNFPQYFYGIRYLGHSLTSTENSRRSSQGNPAAGGVKHEG